MNTELVLGVCLVHETHTRSNVAAIVGCMRISVVGTGFRVVELVYSTTQVLIVVCFNDWSLTVGR